MRHRRTEYFRLSSYSARARATAQARRREVFRAWVAALPAAGWSGTVGDLFAELAAFLAGHSLRFGTLFPAGAGLSKWLDTAAAEIAAAEIAAAGRRLALTRTKSERLVTIRTPH